ALSTDGPWWPLAPGRPCAGGGRGLPRAPLLFPAGGPPEPAAWLFDLSLHALGRAGGFEGLRLAHATAVAGILAAVWALARRTGVSAAGASVPVGAFAALSGYRLFQLRPAPASVARRVLPHHLLPARPAP